MRIAHIVCAFPPYYSGMGNVVFETASGLIKLGHEVEVFTPRYDEPGEETIKFAKRLKPSLQYGNSAYLPQIGKELEAFDLVHLHYPFFGVANLVRKWKIKNPNKPLVITYHMDNRAKGLQGLFFKYYAKYWMPKILGSADLLISSSFDYLENSDAKEIYKTNKSKWLEIPFGVKTEKFIPREKPLSLFEKYDLDINNPTILFVGGMDLPHYFKGIPVLLDALLILKKNNFPVQAVLVGDGELREDFEIRAKAYGLSKSIRFVGRVKDIELPNYYNMADLLVLPSTTKGEAFGMVLLEAMASGVPVIASDLPGVRSVANDGGLVFEVGNAGELAGKIADYFSNNENIEDWKKDVRNIAVEKYGWEKIVGKLDEAYKIINSKFQVPNSK